MITEEQVRQAAFWEEDLICLSCGGVFEDLETEEVPCEVCGGQLIHTGVAILVLDNVGRMEEQA